MAEDIDTCCKLAKSTILSQESNCFRPADGVTIVVSSSLEPVHFPRPCVCGDRPLTLIGGRDKKAWCLIRLR